MHGGSSRSSISSRPKTPCFSKELGKTLLRFGQVQNHVSLTHNHRGSSRTATVQAFSLVVEALLALDRRLQHMDRWHVGGWPASIFEYIRFECVLEVFFNLFSVIGKSLAWLRL